jgi:hypothetical protein
LIEHITQSASMPLSHHYRTLEDEIYSPMLHLPPAAVGGYDLPHI